MDLYSAADFSTEWDDLWFPLSIIASKSEFRFFLFSWTEIVTIPLLNFAGDISPILVMEE